MRQYRIFYRRAPSKDFVRLEPLVHRNLYQRTTVLQVIDLMRHSPVIEGVALRIEDEQYNIMAFDQPAEAPDAFKFEEP